MHSITAAQTTINQRLITFCIDCYQGPAPNGVGGAARVGVQEAHPLKEVPWQHPMAFWVA